MKDIKPIIAKNILELRQANGMTQFDLAEKLNYSDKAISKWERGESCPDISVLLQISDMFSVPPVSLVREESTKEQLKAESKKVHRYNRSMITGISILLVVLVALFVFVVITLSVAEAKLQWLSFLYAVPTIMIVWLIMNSIWFNRRRNYMIISLLMWSLLAATHISFLTAGVNIWLIYLLGIPGQIIILLWSMIKKKKNM